MASEYSNIPRTATISPTPFNISIPEPKLQLMKDLISLSPIGPVTYENTTATVDYGISHAWLNRAKVAWTSSFDWRQHEASLNTLPHFTVPIRDKESGIEVSIHFMALFSQNPDATPLALYHGWPGSFLEFVPIVNLLKDKYTPETLPYHVVVPSLPGFAFSGGPPTDRDFEMSHVVRLFDKLMTGLFGPIGYIAHGGDQGQSVALGQASRCEACMGVHVNNVLMSPPEDGDKLEMTDVEKSVLHRRQEFMGTGIGYAMEQGTKPATVGLAISASPIALLAWIGEKWVGWTDVEPTLELILEAVSLYWLTDTFPRSIWHYRAFMTKGPPKWPYISKPVGYSYFPQDIVPVPVSWLKTFANVVVHREHNGGGHFPGSERPHELLTDLEEFVAVAKGQ